MRESINHRIYKEQFQLELKEILESNLGKPIDINNPKPTNNRLSRILMSNPEFLVDYNGTYFYFPNAEIYIDMSTGNRGSYISHPHILNMPYTHPCVDWTGELVGLNYAIPSSFKRNYGFDESVITLQSCVKRITTELGEAASSLECLICPPGSIHIPNWFKGRKSLSKRKASKLLNKGVRVFRLISLEVRVNGIELFFAKPRSIKGQFGLGD